MAEIRPFRAWRFDFESLDRDVSQRIAPPYDILDASDKQRLLDVSDRNVVAIDLPFAPAKALGPPECYEKAGALFEVWCADGTLLREQTPAVYAYHQVFQHDGRCYTRRMFLARLRLEPFSAGNVLPHEETFGGPKEDRLALMKATRANLSPIFGLYRDPHDDYARLFDSATRQPPDAIAHMESVENRLWMVRDEQAINALRDVFADRRVFIADGHHRYNTALNYRDWLADQRGGSLAADHAAQFVMVAFGSMDDPGNLILPTHRVLTETGGWNLDELLALWADGCQPVEGEGELTAVDGPSGRAQALRFTNRSILDALEPNRSDAWRALDLAYLHRYLFDELLATRGGAPPVVRYAKSADQARRTAAEQDGIALLCKAVTMAELRAVSEAGDVMPQKSTYFYPKIATGLTINPLE